MGEAILTRVGGSKDPNTPELKWILCTEIITKNTDWTVPSNIRNGEISVRLFGGGGSIECGMAYGNTGVGSGGGGGWMNNKILTLASGTVIPITIGMGGNFIKNNSTTVFGTGHAGGTTSFGSYLSANGGTAANGSNAGSGGSGGGGRYIGGIGFQFGGGGGGGCGDDFGYYCPNGGNGGKWGGGGGAGGLDNITSKNNNFITHGGTGGWFNNNGIWSKSGLAGDGGYSGFNNGILNRPSINGYDGTNTSNILDEDIDSILSLSKNGMGGKSGECYPSYGLYSGGGGGGGYGGNGGKSSNCIYINQRSRAYSCGGGGNGALYYDGSYNKSNMGGIRNIGGGGGGGGYGGKGADGGNGFGGGGGGYGIGNYGAGGGGTAINGNNGKQGICIIQYYQLGFV